MAEQTLTYSMGANGWTSFHSYIPEWMTGMNSVFYSFKTGDIYEHHSNASRNRYYGVNYPSTVTAVFNDSPIDAKMFKTIELEGTDAWEVEVVTDLTTAFIDVAYFVKKEGVYYSNIRRYAISQDLTETSAQGIGTCSLVTGAAPGTIVITFAQPINGLISPRDPAIPGSIGDVAYIGTGAGITAIGPITAVSIGVFPAVSTITVTPTTATPVIGDFIMFLKNSEVESYGSRGYYAEVKLTNNLTTESELFALSTEVFKSFP